MHLALGYLLLTGCVTATVQVARGAVRGAARVIQGEFRAALGEVIAGAAAPAVSAVQQLRGLGEDVCASVTALVGETEADELPEPQVLPRRQRSRVAAPANGMPT
jgi:hypothetical protein